MADYLIQGQTLTDIADQIRVLSGEQETLSPAEMGNTIDAFNTKLGEVVAEQDEIILQIAEALQGKAIEDDSNNILLQNKAVTPTTATQTITADSGYDGLNTVTVDAMPTATQATPSISVNSSGLITASVTQSTGYVEGSTKTVTQQLATKGTATITPSDVEQTAVSAGTYVTGDIKVGASAGVQVVKGTVTVGFDGTNTITISPGFPIKTAAIAKKIATGTDRELAAALPSHALYANGSGTCVGWYNRIVYGSITKTDTETGSTFTMSGDNKFTQGTYEYIVTS